MAIPPTNPNRFEFVILGLQIQKCPDVFSISNLFQQRQHQHKQTKQPSCASTRGSRNHKPNGLLPDEVRGRRLTDIPKLIRPVWLAREQTHARIDGKAKI
jgi:hypothetical protein